MNERIPLQYGLRNLLSIRFSIESTSTMLTSLASLLQMISLIRISESINDTINTCWSNTGFVLPDLLNRIRSFSFSRYSSFSLTVSESAKLLISYSIFNLSKVKYITSLLVLYCLTCSTVRRKLLNTHSSPRQTRRRWFRRQMRCFDLSIAKYPGDSIALCLSSFSAGTC